MVTQAGAAPQYQEFPEPESAPGFEIVELVAAAIHPVVRAKADGVHYSSTDQYPMVPGVDAVARKADGTLVYTGETRLPWGTVAERMAVPMAAPLPPGADPVTVAAAMNPGMSSWMPLTAHVDERGVPGTVLILGPTGAAGGLAVQNARALGVQRTIGVGRGAADLARVAGIGAETVELTGDKAQDAKAIAAALDGRSPELVLDYLWGTPAESAFEALHSIPDAAPTNHVEIGSFPMDRYLVQGMAYLQVLADGKITVDATTYLLEQCTDAWNAGPGPRAVLTAG